MSKIKNSVGSKLSQINFEYFLNRTNDLVFMPNSKKLEKYRPYGSWLYDTHNKLFLKQYKEWRRLNETN